GYVRGWDDPRLVTLSALRRRGCPPAAIHDFVERVGVAKAFSVVDYGLLEACIRDNLNANAPRAMAVLNPLRVVIENYPEGQSETLEVERHPDHPEMGVTKVAFSREIFVEREDFMLDPPKKYFRLYPGNEVRLKGAYFIKCTGYETDENGEVTLLRCTYDPASKGGNSPDGRKVRGTLHWIDASTAVEAEVRLYDRLFNVPNPTGDDYLEHVNPNSLVICPGAKVDPETAAARPGDTFQFMRQGYFCADADGTPERPVFNRTVALNSSW
ncbi:MAG: glutamate--tRNA ligase family protein, partial [Firmicutes bacterium]|nr:glutamate--tRNA ligase family protein [Bacillota bacterium]